MVRCNLFYIYMKLSTCLTMYVHVYDLSVYSPYLCVYVCQMSFIYYLFFSQHWEIVQDSGSWPALNEATSSHPPPPPPPATKESPQQKEQKKVSHSLLHSGLLLLLLAVSSVITKQWRTESVMKTH